MVQPTSGRGHRDRARLQYSYQRDRQWAIFFVVFISTRLVSTTPARICRGKTLFSILEFNMVSSSIRYLATNKVVEQELPLLLLFVLEVFPPLPLSFDVNLKFLFLLLYLAYTYVHMGIYIYKVSDK